MVILGWVRFQHPLNHPNIHMPISFRSIYHNVGITTTYEKRNPQNSSSQSSSMEQTEPRAPAAWARNFCSLYEVSRKSTFENFEGKNYPVQKTDNSLNRKESRNCFSSQA